jgi:hypothetical protein
MKASIPIVVKLKEQIKVLKKEKAQFESIKQVYKKAYEELNCYFDSISDEEQPKVAKKLDKIFKNNGSLKNERT